MKVRNCPRCTGNMLIEDSVLDRDWVCLQCGNRMEVIGQTVFGNMVHGRGQRVTTPSLVNRRPESVAQFATPSDRPRRSA